jgi:hypothetical protein
VIIPVDEVVVDDPRYAEYKVKNPTGYCPYQAQVTKRVPVYDTARLPSFLNAFGLLASDVVMASSVPQRPRAATTRQARLVGSQARAFKFDPNGRGEASDHYWQEADVDLTKVTEGVYVEISKWKFVGSVLGTKPMEFKNWLRKFESAGFKLPDTGLIGVKTADMKKFQTAKNWITVDKYVTRVLKDAWQSKDFQLCYRILNQHEEEDYLRSLAGFNSKSSLSPKFKSLVARLHDIMERANKVHAYTGLVGYVADAAWQKEMNTRDSAVTDLVREATTRYPLLPYLVSTRYSHRDAPENSVIEYARLIDNNEGK